MSLCNHKATRELDEYLSRKVQSIDPSAIVYVVDRGTDAETWALDRPDSLVILGSSWGRAKQSVLVWVRSERARKK